MNFVELRVITILNPMRNTIKSINPSEKHTSSQEKPNSIVKKTITDKIKLNMLRNAYIPHLFSFSREGENGLAFLKLIIKLRQSSTKEPNNKNAANK